ncbi:uncharacterized protein LOC129780441 isoform X2 [Toxorhynchites rutilus septentrionalis]|uniref:uncharacterized protein LOC129780441 isoform X2 n=1 Tax=Toxorhynchites rutilus septentrionalis TaxID=329112 RepID=UPI0024791B2C|nr:uncharacterized protein LOC129780441 isoform X2 [Toxorhynchites rutilus septentrionalis]
MVKYILLNTIVLVLVLVFSNLVNGFHYRSATVAEKITNHQELMGNLTGSSSSLRILEYTITPYDLNPEWIKLVGRYVFLAPRENNLYFVGFEEKIYKSNGSKIVTDLISKNLVTNIFRVQREKLSVLEKIYNLE